MNTGWINIITHEDTFSTIRTRTLLLLISFHSLALRTGHRNLECLSIMADSNLTARFMNKTKLLTELINLCPGCTVTLLYPFRIVSIIKSDYLVYEHINYNLEEVKQLKSLRLTERCLGCYLYKTVCSYIKPYMYRIFGGFKAAFCNIFMNSRPLGILTKA